MSFRAICMIILFATAQCLEAGNALSAIRKEAHAHPIVTIAAIPVACLSTTIILAIAVNYAHKRYYRSFQQLDAMMERNRLNNAAITIQAHVRGMLARQKNAELKKLKALAIELEHEFFQNQMDIETHYASYDRLLEEGLEEQVILMRAAIQAHDAATTIQAQVRGMLARKAAMRAEHIRQDELDAAPRFHKCSIQ